MGCVQQRAFVLGAVDKAYFYGVEARRSELH
jgi:hypothetical protein